MIPRNTVTAVIVPRGSSASGISGPPLVVDEASAVVARAFLIAAFGGRWPSKN